MGGTVLLDSRETAFAKRDIEYLDPKILHPKTSHRMFGHMHGVLNKIYLQIFLHGWIVNREMSLMSLLNPWFATVLLQ